MRVSLILVAVGLLGGGCVSSRESAAGADADAGAAARDPSFGFEGGGPVDPLASDASLSVRADQVFGGCQGGPESACHGSGAGGTYLRLGAGGDLVDVPSTERPSLLRVRPGDPTSSYVYLKVLGDGGIDGGRMPLAGSDDPRLPAFIAAWIEAGAPSP
jgi:hypothetical protein